MDPDVAALLGIDPMMPTGASARPRQVVPDHRAQRQRIAELDEAARHLAASQGIGYEQAMLRLQRAEALGGWVGQRGPAPLYALPGSAFCRTFADALKAVSMT